MNERIKELEKQAIEYSWNQRNSGLDLDAIMRKKFAELIVRECNRIITNNGIATSEHDRCVRKDCVNEILDNFDINNTL